MPCSVHLSLAVSWSLAVLAAGAVLCRRWASINILDQHMRTLSIYYVNICILCRCTGSTCVYSIDILPDKTPSPSLPPSRPPSHAYARTRAHAHARAHMRAHTHMHARAHTHMHTHALSHVHTRAHTHMHTRGARICTHARAHGRLRNVGAAACRCGSASVQYIDGVCIC